MNTKKQIAIIEDEEPARFVYRESLNALYETTFFPDLKSFRSACLTNGGLRADLLIADLQLPDGNFLDFLGDEKTSELLNCPFLVISSCDELNVLRTCFDEGALDYLTKPFTKNALIAKVERFFQSNSQLALDPCSHSLKMGSRTVAELTTKEFQILYILQRANGDKVSRQLLQKEVWHGVAVSEKALDVHIFNLRNKLKGLPVHIRHVAPASFMLSSDGVHPEIKVI